MELFNFKKVDEKSRETVPLSYYYNWQLKQVITYNSTILLFFLTLLPPVITVVAEIIIDKETPTRKC
jgi:hypothetical protein